MNDRQLSDADKARALARFGSLRGHGGVRIMFVAFGPVVPARDPDELATRVLEVK